MGVMCDYLQDALINFLFRGGSFSPPSTVYMALHSGDPGSAGTANEISGTNYERLALATSVWSAPVAGSGIVTLNTDVLSAIAGSEWGNIPWVTIKSALTSGNSWMKFEVPDGGFEVHTGERFRLLAGSYSVGLI